MIPISSEFQSQVVNFIRSQNVNVNSAVWLERFYQEERTTEEILELRYWTDTIVKNLTYSKGCEPFQVVDAPDQSLRVDSLTFPWIRAEVEINGCDINAYTVSPSTGTIIPVRQRYDLEVNRKMSAMLQAQKQTHIAESINLLKYGYYNLYDSYLDQYAQVNFSRDSELVGLDLTGTEQAWSDVCSRPIETIETVLQKMNKFSAASGIIDVVQSPLAWQALQNHDEAKSARHSQMPRIDEQTDPLFFTYKGWDFKGTTNGGRLRHWVDYSEYKDHNGDLVPALAPGEIMIISNDGFEGRRIWRTVSKDGRRFIPDNLLPFFLFDGEDEYDPKCEVFRPYMKESHLFVPRNVNGAVLMRVVADDYVPCAPCAACEEG